MAEGGISWVMGFRAYPRGGPSRDGRVRAGREDICAKKRKRERRPVRVFQYETARYTDAQGL